MLADGKNPGPGGMIFLNISLHRFADTEAAASALTYFADQAAMSYDLRDGKDPALGDIACLLADASDGVPLAVLYVQRDQLLYRVSGSSADAAGDSATDVLAVARTLLEAYDAPTQSPAP